MSSTRTKIVVAGGAAALTLGIAAPALAHGSDGNHAGQGQHQRKPVTLAEAKAWATAALAHETTWLDDVKKAIAADDNLSSSEKATYTAKADAALDSVAKAKTAVDDATTVAQVKAAVKSASPRLAFPHPDKPTLADVKQRATDWLDAASARLTALKTKIAGDDKLTDAQKAAVTAKIDKELSAIADAKTAVSNATTDKEIKDALASARLVPVHYPKHQRPSSGTSASGSATLVTHRSGARSVTVSNADGTDNGSDGDGTDPSHCQHGRGGNGSTDGVGGRHSDRGQHHGGHGGFGRHGGFGGHGGGGR